MEIFYLNVSVYSDMMWHCITITVLVRTYNVRYASVSSNPCTLPHLTSVSERRRNPVAPTPVKCLRVHRAIRLTTTKSSPRNLGRFPVSWSFFGKFFEFYLIFYQVCWGTSDLLDISYPSRYRRIIDARDRLRGKDLGWFQCPVVAGEARLKTLDANARAENGHRVFQSLARWHERPDSTRTIAWTCGGRATRVLRDTVRREHARRPLPEKTSPPPSCPRGGDFPRSVRPSVRLSVCLSVST